jgi:hypothetical protein
MQASYTLIANTVLKNNIMDTLQDNSPMPFGKHKGEPMRDVPASYLFYLWSNGMDKEDKPVANYIRENLDAFKMEYPDGEW